MNAPLPESIAIEGRDRVQRQTEVVAALSQHLPAHALLWHREDTVPYECDGLTAYRERCRSWCCRRPRSRSRPCSHLSPPGVPVVARGAGTGLSGGAMPHRWGVTLSLAKFNRILKIDVACTAVVQCGVRNLAISEAAAPYGLYYAPDPSSQIACTIGGNVAENSGRRALPEVRADAAQRAARARLHRDGEPSSSARRARCAGPRPAGGRRRQRRHARRDVSR
jgi:glycolate oxidase